MTRRQWDSSRYVDDRPAQQIFRVHRDVYADPALFELEQRYIFERSWAFLCHESQLPKAHDYIASHIGRQPVLVTRDAKGQLRGFLNACRHKGAQLTRMDSGNKRYHVCAYHGWGYDSSGRNVDIKDAKAGGYPAAFAGDNHDLLPLAQLASYKGLVFGSLSAEVQPLEEHLGGLRPVMDLALDQGEHGMEFVPGRISLIYHGNWKMQMDNGIDPYHLTSTHAGFMDVMGRRRDGEGNQAARQFDWQKRLSQQGGAFLFKNGHSAIWLNQAEVEKRPIYPAIEAIRARVGDTRADWMLKLRNLTVFPNMQIADSTSLLVRSWRALAVDRTELRYWCLAPVGEPAAQRAWRLRQFEDFFNVSGMATPDDTVLYEDMQRGLAGDSREHGMGWLQGHTRGISDLRPGADEAAQSLGLQPEACMQGLFDTQTETAFIPVYREWARLMQAGAERDGKV